MYLRKENPLKIFLKADAEAQQRIKTKLELDRLAPDYNLGI